MTRLALFDCDGTLADSAANIVVAMRRAFAAHGLPAPPDTAVRAIVGLSLVEAMAALAPDAGHALHASLAEGYRAAFRAMRGTPDFADEPLFPGIVEALDTLRADDWLLGVATGKSDRGLALLLAEHDLTDRFVTLQTADRHPSKPHPAMAAAAMAEAGVQPEHTVVIGDTRFDVMMANAAGAAAIGVGWGYHPPAALREAGAAAIVAHASALPAALSTLVPAPISPP